MKIAELPFHERPVVELLALDREGDPEYAGYGWARVERLYLSTGCWPPRRLEDVLVVAVHASDDGPALADDVELTFELPDGARVSVHASAFLERWLPRLPQARAIVLAMCNEHRAALRRPAAAAGPLHHGLGNVYAWDLDRGDRIRLHADGWRTLRPVSNELERPPGCVISDEEKIRYAGLYILKKMDLKLKKDPGGVEFPVVLPNELYPLEEVLHQLALDGYVEMKKDRWVMTKQGLAYLGEHIDEARDLVEEFDDDEIEVADMLAELEARNLDPFRARFLWAWFDGEIDDLALYQERRGVKPVEKMWGFYLMSDEFWNNLALELEGD